MPTCWLERRRGPELGCPGDPLRVRGWYPESSSALDLRKLARGRADEKLCEVPKLPRGSGSPLGPLSSLGRMLGVITAVAPLADPVPPPKRGEPGSASSNEGRSMGDPQT